MRSRRPPIGPGGFKMAKRPHDGHYGASLAAPMAAKMTQKGTKMPPRDHNMSPSGPKVESKGDKMAPRDFNMSPQRAQDGPNSTSDGTKMVPRGLQREQIGCQNGGNIGNRRCAQNTVFPCVFPIKRTFPNTQNGVIFQACDINCMT